MLGWIWKKGKARLKTLYKLPQTPLYEPQPDGTQVPIEIKTVSDPEKKLGVYTCPMGNFPHHVGQLLTTGSEYAKRLDAQKLPARDARKGTCNQLFPKLIYGSAAVTHSPQKLEEASQSIWYKLLPSLSVNSNITKKYRMLPLHYQGLALPNPNIDALSKKIHLLQAHWDMRSTSGRILHQAYQVFQVEIDLSGNIFSLSFEAFGRFATHGLFRNLWGLLHRYGVLFHLYVNFGIPLLCEHDRTLMDAVKDTGIFDRREQETINRYQNYKGVHNIGDMVCSDGPTIDPIMLTKEAGQSSREFPLQFPTGPDHKLWLKMTHSLTQIGHKLWLPLGRYISIPHRPD
jgi:hypothetical protein